MRSPSSPAEQELLRLLAEAGYPTTTHALEHWRAHGLAPSLPRRALGRGRGSTSWLNEPTVRQTLSAAQAVRATRSVTLAATVMFARGVDLAEPTVRRAFVATIDKLMASADAETLPGEDILDTLDRWARRAARGVSPAIRRSRKRLARQGRKVTNADLLFMQAAAIIGGEIDGYVAETLVLGSGLEPTLIEDPDKSAHGLTEILKDINLADLRRMALEAPWSEIRGARDFICQLKGFADVLAGPAAAQGKPEALGLAEVNQADDLGQAFMVLGAIGLLRRLPVEASELLSMMAAETPRLQAVSALLAALGRPEMPEGVEAYMASLSDDARASVEQVTRDWALANPEAAALLSA